MAKQSQAGSEKTIAARFLRDHAGRDAMLRRKRLAARLSIPWLFPDEDYANVDPDELDLPENYQSLVARGCANMASRLMLATWPVGAPAFEYMPNAGIMEDERVPVEVKQALLSRLHTRDVVIQSALEAGLRGKAARPQCKVRFRTSKYNTMLSLVVLGDSLSRIHPDFRWSHYRLENYVTDRDSCGDVNYHIIREYKDLAYLDDKTLRDTFGLTRDEVNEMGDSQRVRQLFTWVRWQPNSKKWLIEQEVAENERSGVVINETDERVSSFISNYYALSPEDNYGRGFVELNIGDAYSFDSLSLHIREFAAMCAKMVPVIDGASDVKPRDLMRPSGVPLVGARVSNGQAQDIGFLRIDKTADFAVVFQTHQALRRDLGASMLIESEIQPQKERVTREQIISIRNELETASAGVLASINDNDVEATVTKADEMLVKQRIIQPLPKDAAEMRTLTGITALSQAIRRQRLENFIRTAPLLGEVALQRIDMGAALNALARYDNIDEPGIVKTDEQIKRETRAAMQQQLVAAAGERAIDAAGTIAETQAEAALQPAAI